MNQIPKISIIVPMYNCERFILATIKSVQDQTFTSWELLLVDDCSTDNTLSYVSTICDTRIHIIRYDQNKGAYYARNRGLEVARGRYICYLDSDDLWKPNKLEEQLKFMSNNNYFFSFTAYEYANEMGISVGKTAQVPASLNFHQAMRNTIIFTSTVMFDSHFIDKTLFTMPHIESEDTATWWQVLKSGYTAYGLNTPLTYYRRSDHSLSANKFRGIWRIWNLYRTWAGLSILDSLYNFLFYAFHATIRRI